MFIFMFDISCIFTSGFSRTFVFDCWCFHGKWNILLFIHIWTAQYNFLTVCLLSRFLHHGCIIIKDKIAFQRFKHINFNAASAHFRYTPIGTGCLMWPISRRPSPLCQHVFTGTYFQLALSWSPELFFQFRRDTKLISRSDSVICATAKRVSRSITTASITTSTVLVPKRYRISITSTCKVPHCYRSFHYTKLRVFV